MALQPRETGEILNFATASAETYNLGTGFVRAEGGLYSVGVSNQLQVPYGGKFAEIGFANTPTGKLPKDFVKFRIGYWYPQKSGIDLILGSSGC